MGYLCVLQPLPNKNKQTNKQETNVRYELIPLKQNANSLNLAKCKKDGISWSNKF